MEHIAALLLIIGCSDDLSQCRELPAPVPLYEAAEDCNRALPDSARRFHRPSMAGCSRYACRLTPRLRKRMLN